MRKLILLFCLSLPAFGTINGTMQWDVRTTGSNSNSGGYDPGVVSPGTDESQQDSGTAISITLATGTTGTGSPAFTSTTHGPGNTVNVTGGSGCTTGTFEILSQAAGVATFDRTMGTATDVCTAVLGGSLLTPTQANTNVANGNTIWIKNGTYTISASITNSQNSEVFEGYASTHGDIGTPPLLTSSTASINMLQVTEGNASVGFINLKLSFTGAANYSLIAANSGNNGRAYVYHCIFDLTAASGGNGVYISNGRPDIAQLVIGSTFLLNSTSYGINDQGGNNSTTVILNNYFTGGAAGVYDGNNSNNQRWIIQGNVFNGNSRGVYAQASGLLWLTLIGNDFYGQTNQNVYDPSPPATVIAENNIFWGGTYGISFVGAGPYMAFSQSNAYGNQSTAPYLNWIPGINGSDITLSASPFVNVATPNFALNSTAGGGAALKAAGFPGVSPAGTGYLDIGALQSQAAAGSSIASGAYVQ